MDKNRYVNIESIDLNEMSKDLYFRGYLFQYQNVDKLEYQNQNSIIYINYDDNTQNLKNDVYSFNPNITNLLTNKKTFQNIWKIIPENITKVIIGDQIISEYHQNKYTYYPFLCTNDDEILDYLIENKDKIEKITKIRDHFNNSCLVELSVNRCYKTINFIFEYLIENNEKYLINLINEHNILNKTIYSYLIEYFGSVDKGDNIVNYMLKYISDDNLNRIDNSNSSILLELLLKNKFDIAETIIHRVDPKVLNTKELAYGISPQYILNQKLQI